MKHYLYVLFKYYIFQILINIFTIEYRQIKTSLNFNKNKERSNIEIYFTFYKSFIENIKFFVNVHNNILEFINKDEKYFVFLLLN